MGLPSGPIAFTAALMIDRITSGVCLAPACCCTEVGRYEELRSRAPCGSLVRNHGCLNMSFILYRC